MKFFIAIVALAAVVLSVQAQLTEEQKLKLRSHHEHCLEETGVDKEVVANARKGQFSDDIKLKEHLFCVAKKIGFLNEEGRIQKEVLLAKLRPVINDDAVAQRLIETCAVEKSTPGETALETVKCYFVESPKHISIL